MSMIYSQIRAFHAVASHGSFTRAAAALSVSQPTLSSQVKALEAKYEVDLFIPAGRGIEITPLGRRLHAITQKQFRLEAEAELLLSETRSLKAGFLRIGADSPYHALPLVARYQERYPGIEISMNFGNSRDTLADLMARRIDVAIIPPPPEDDPRLISQLLIADRLVAFVPKAHKWAKQKSVNLKRLAGTRVILREEGSTTRAVFEAAVAAAGMTLKDVFEIGSREAVRAAVVEGLGVGVVSEAELIRGDNIHVLPISGADLRVPEHLVCLAECAPQRTIKAVFDLLED
ncbi:LysR substrate-binding domain-containing protein [Denitrobaculum tricleocarpae]|uniref:LysR family transcriptional regulator n=1 Tax=Denitrobaculum tricleocarpae TaxID=2591009 RepID=A0A545TG06_9PROT|nr:LysR substrate-binding domain-containing protein [Denitrobaculum tricleocarpae]TQV76153.1 LysR family transcriptional regulator [Denitrobaculum tricleocarpae]